MSIVRGPVLPGGGLAYYYQPSFYGSCAAVDGKGVVANQCLPGTTAIATRGNGCYCYDPSTGWAGCGNTSNGVCRAPTALYGPSFWGLSISPFSSPLVPPAPIGTFPVVIQGFRG